MECFYDIKDDEKTLMSQKTLHQGYKILIGTLMAASLTDRVIHSVTKWLIQEAPPQEFPLCDFERLCHEIRPCDVLLIEGRSQVSDVIRAITTSPWTHAALYIGRLYDIENPVLRERVKQFYHEDESSQLVIESVLGKGTVITPVTHYKQDHIRICRPKGISRKDTQRVIGYAIGRLGFDYDVRQILDLARLLFPWRLLPRHWRSTLFAHNAGKATRMICSTLIAEAFESVKFPVLPLVKKNEQTGIELIPRNPRLYTPSNFDYSPYFEIIKYPMFQLHTQEDYQNLPWVTDGRYSNDSQGIVIPERIQQAAQATANLKQIISDNATD